MRFRSTVADVIAFDPGHQALNMIYEIIEMKQKTLRVEMEMNVSFYFPCNVSEGHGLQSTEQIENLLKDTHRILSIKEQETLSLKDAYNVLNVL